MAIKRKSTFNGLERRVRPRREDEWEEDADVQGSSSDEEASEEGGARTLRQSDGESEDDASSEDESEDDVAQAKTETKLDLSSVSFGALARAQASLPPTDRRKNKNPKDDDEGAPSTTPAEAPFKRAPKPPQRTSKHAPQEQTSKRAVSRRREVVADTRPKPRDPRFDAPPPGGAIDAIKARKAYAFLDDYRESEMAELRAQIRKSKNPEHKERLKRELLSMESRKKARAKKDEQDRVLAEHRRQEKELVAQGKKPFYLKKSEQKKRLLTERFAGMSEGQVNKAIERKRKKVAGKEKKELDFLQRPRSRH
ncbi:hypothetical protein S7711_07652 [Stachybotrys chartarum IBT 7711]|uniref:rRNA biogenesis protein RRP36 n=1 Tax=Stachybotrys chartarum (strain CBS 109288 / IBT 7711) TaxID=1280523 RepID=A0A084ALL6_STACB|nr:hypothetical protein S7711_07652 [Stachybotrys chartarum IBT 7711]KFA47077.1 hypothetical protein S40293_04641 [Stachybotrys chartarum IBT 40293]KFA75491.1 hypothetical protein S40288_01194 [Stachybotrys chartarum IBT 40288]